LINIIKIRFIAILIAISVSNTFAQAEDLKTQNNIDELNYKVLLLESKFAKLQETNNKFLQENQSLINSQTALKNKHRQLLNDFATYKKNTEMEINSLQKKIGTNSTNITNITKTASEFESKIENIQRVTNQNIADLNKKTRINATSIKNTASGLENQIDETEKKMHQNISELNKKFRINSTTIETIANDLGSEIEKSKKATNQSISVLNKTVSQNMLYWIIAVLAVALFVLAVFILLRKQIFEQKTDLDSNLHDTRKVLEEEGIKLDNKLIEVLESQLKIINSQGAGENKEVDHSLALKVADEIIRIQKNLTRMGKKTKGLKQLNASVKRIQDNFASNGYELVEMLGKSYNDGIKASVNFIPDEDLRMGEQIVSRIIKPQVNYQGVMIQTAQIEVNQGE